MSYEKTMMLSSFKQYARNVQAALKLILEDESMTEGMIRNLQRFCRLCATQFAKDMQGALNLETKSEWMEVLRNQLGLNLNEEQYPKFICVKCLKQLGSCHKTSLTRTEGHTVKFKDSTEVQAPPIPNRIHNNEHIEVNVLVKSLVEHNCSRNSDEAPLTKKGEDEAGIQGNNMDIDDAQDVSNSLMDCLSVKEKEEIPVKSGGRKVRTQEDQYLDDVEEITEMLQQLDQETHQHSTSTKTLAECTTPRKRMKFDIQCIECPETFTQLQLYMDHVRESHKEVEKPFRCVQCSKAFRVRRTLMRHMRESHDGLAPSKPAKHKCCQCNRSFKRKEQLSQHMAVTHEGLRPYKCDYCGKTFGARKTLRIHKMQHLNERPYKCDLCPKAFRQHCELRVHKERHSTDASLLCPVCKRGKANAMELEEHLKEHREKLVCTLCGKMFKRKANLEDHKKAVHEKQRPFKCRHCEQSFGLQSTRAIHERTHDTAKPYKCEECGKAFKQPSSLYNHMKVHKKTDAKEARTLELKSSNK